MPAAHDADGNVRPHPCEVAIVQPKACAQERLKIQEFVEHMRAAVVVRAEDHERNQSQRRLVAALWRFEP